MNKAIAQVMTDLAKVTRPHQKVTSSELCHLLIGKHSRYRGLQPWLLNAVLDTAGIRLRYIEVGRKKYATGIHTSDVLPVAYQAKLVMRG